MYMLCMQEVAMVRSMEQYECRPAGDYRGVTNSAKKECDLKVLANSDSTGYYQCVTQLIVSWLMVHTDRYEHTAPELERLWQLAISTSHH